MRWAAVRGAVFGIAVMAAVPALADEIADKLEAARTAYSHADALRTLAALQAAETALTVKLVDQFGRIMPPPPAGWDATPSESQSLDEVGGGLTVTRGYQKGASVLTASLIVDNPSVANSIALFQPATGSTDGAVGWKPVKLGAENALVRFDPPNREGEILLVIQGRAALQIEGSEIDGEQILVDTAQGWNLVQLRKLLGS